MANAIGLVLAWLEPVAFKGVASTIGGVAARGGLPAALTGVSKMFEVGLGSSGNSRVELFTGVAKIVLRVGPEVNSFVVDALEGVSAMPVCAGSRAVTLRWTVPGTMEGGRRTPEDGMQTSVRGAASMDVGLINGF